MSAKEAAEKILACPFCGGNDFDFTRGTPDREGTPTNVICTECAAAGPWSYVEDGATEKPIKEWNTRAYASKLAEIRGILAKHENANEPPDSLELIECIVDAVAALDGLMKE